MSVDILKEKRSGSRVSGNYLSRHILYESPERLKELQAIWERIEKDPAFSKRGRNSLGHTERYTDACRKVVSFINLVNTICKERNKEQLSLDELYDLYLAVDESLPLDVHMSMFVPLMRYHTSAEQRTTWLDDAVNFRIIGAYAQTELAHGSNVRGIETTATYKRPTSGDADGHFVLHSPSMSSTKWWPGGLGHTATHAVVYAQLIIEASNVNSNGTKIASRSDKCYGVHAFLVPLRNRTTHAPLPGIICGDIGPKLGYNSMDNGFARFDHVIVPRFNMLAGFANVTREGKYTRKPGAEKIAYGIMLDVRVRIVVNSAYALARALTIALRYSFVRKQGGNETGVADELPVIQHRTQQRILLPTLAFAWGLHFVGCATRAQYNAYATSAYPESDSSKPMTVISDEALRAAEKMLPDMHLRSACLKAYVTQRVHDSMEALRKSCGGNGFLSSAGFAELMTNYLPMCTLEGTREVLGQQAGRALLKARLKRQTLAADMCTGSINGCSQSTVSVSTNTLISRAVAISHAVKEGSEGAVLLTLSELAGYANILLARATYVVDQIKMNVERLESHVARSSVVQVLKTSESSASLAAVASELVTASEVYAEYLIAQAFCQRLQQLQQAVDINKHQNGASSSCASCIDTPTLLALQKLFVLLCFSFIEQAPGDAILSGIIEPKQLPQLRVCIANLCSVLVDDSINLVEAWCITDERLDSTLGRADGLYMQALLESAQDEPLNRDAAAHGGVGDAYRKYLHQVLRGDASRIPVARAKI